MGRFDEPQKSIAAARDLDPLSDTIVFASAVLHYCKGDDGIAMEECRAALRLSEENAGAHSLLALLYLGRGDLGAAQLEVKAADRVGGDSGVRAFTGYVYGRLGDPAQSQRILRELDAESTDPFVSGQVLLGMGEMEQAAERFRKAVETHSSFLVIFYGNPYLKEVLDDPRLSSLLVGAGLKRA